MEFRADATREIRIVEHDEEAVDLAVELVKILGVPERGDDDVGVVLVIADVEDAAHGVFVGEDGDLIFLAAMLPHFREAAR